MACLFPVNIGQDINQPPDLAPSTKIHNVSAIAADIRPRNRRSRCPATKIGKKLRCVERIGTGRNKGKNNRRALVW